MKYRHSALSLQTFQDPAESQNIQGWQVNYLSFSLPENTHKIPLVILGGSFQSFYAFYNYVQAFLPQMPVILLALPGQTSNQGNQDTHTLGFRDLAEIMDATFDCLGIKTVKVMGFSYGSLIAYAYAAHFESRLDQLILIGCNIELRHTIRQLLNQVLENYQEDQQDQFAEMLTQLLFNFNTLELTGSSTGITKRLTRLLKNISPHELENYRANTFRLLHETMPRRRFHVRTLIVAAQYDHLILPSESLEVFKLFDNASFVMIQKRDHMLPVQAPKLLQKTVYNFLAQEDLECPQTISGIKALNQAQERRIQDRYKVNKVSALLTHQDGSVWQGEIEDVNMDGCGLFITEAQHLSLECSGTWTLEIKDISYSLQGFLKIHRGKASFVFYKPSFKIRDIFGELITKFANFSDRHLGA